MVRANLNADVLRHAARLALALRILAHKGFRLWRLIVGRGNPSLPWSCLDDGKPRPRRIWNKIPDEIGTAIVNLALEEPDLSPRELAVNFTDTKGSFISEAIVYRILKEHGLITSPAFILLKAADRFANPTTAPNQLWQTDFTYLKVIGWGWFYLSTVLDDFSRYILAWKLCTTMSATDASDTLQVALQACLGSSDDKADRGYD